MTTAEWLAVMGVLAGLLLGMSLLHALAARSGAAPEVARKSVHVAMGAVCVTFPWIFDRPLPVWVLAASVTILFAMLRFIPALRRGIGSVLHGIKRFSYGEMLFAPAVAVVFHGARGDAMLYVIPIGILTVSDTASTLAGTRWGKRHYGCGEGFKTIEGSAIFLTTAFLCVFVPLVCSGRVDVVHALWIGLILATLAMMAEGISDRGFDNLVIPLGCFFVLNRLLPLDTPALAGRIIVIILLLALMVPGTRWSTLNGSALLGGVLLGYGCAVLADWRFALPPVAVFVCHLVTARRYNLTKVLDHRFDVMWAHALGCLPWVVLASGGILPRLTCLAGVSFAMATQLAMLDMTTLSWLGRFSPQPLRSTLKGWLIAGLPGLVWFWPDYGRLWLSLGMALIASLLATSLLHRIRPRYRGHATKLWMIEGFLALAASLSALLVHP